MAKSAKNFSNKENGANMVDTPRLSTTEDENAGLLHSREPCDDGRPTRATGRLPRSQLIILTLSLSNAISIAAVLILVVFHGPAFYVPELLQRLFTRRNQSGFHPRYSTMDAYYELIDRLNKNEGTKRELPTDPGWNSEHLNHCWDYLRQTIMCNADVTLEWRKYNEQVGTGWGYQHQCKDWDAIIAWAEKYRYSNNWGILRGGGERIPLQ
ncbi:hypothetical protein CNYM01_09538 [Colletotrichum nymphaeae SA-01]|uniref:Tat pathway signal sequence n=1 Tax=Colletotrichum nymphaeae SA-01 TaxID=1460502 RepID=A0A135T8U2_9PEZI|nr:hypothetical protein CNYM01_09538 [Colletotrichum nymphaeae SA-01]